MNMFSSQLEQPQPLFDEILACLAVDLDKVGLGPGLLPSGLPSHSEWREDPYDHHRSLHVTWRTPDGTYQGAIQLSEDSRVYAEFDIFRPHPQRPGWIIESATAWGRTDALRHELRLIPEPA